jgi:hypothetical protein
VIHAPVPENEEDGFMLIPLTALINVETTD